MDWKEKILNHLDREYTEPIRDTMWGHIYVSGNLKRITASYPFQRLGRIKQLGPAHHVYPGATHTRLAHSFGVFHIAKKMIRRLVTSETCPPLSLEGVKMFLVAALFHDLGHFPYTHSLKELPLAAHEKLSADLVTALPLSRLIEEEFSADPQFIADIIDTSTPISDNDGRGAEITFYRNILSGVLDPDKLDYLNRDAFFCGVPYGMQDIDFIISRIIPHEAAGIGISDQGINAIENILFSKYLMYKTVYWHKTVRIATAMVKKAVFRSLQEAYVAPSDLYGLDDFQFISLFTQKGNPYAPLINHVHHRQLYKSLAETNYSPENNLHTSLGDIFERNALEEKLARELSDVLPLPVSPEMVIIDVPEPISFEIELPIFVSDTLLSFEESGSVFTPPVVKGFTESLRKIRLMLAPEIAERIDVRKHQLERYIR